MKFLLLIFLIPCSVFSQDTDTNEIYISNIITQDCDKAGGCGLEVVSAFQIKSFQITVFNRWGEVVFESKDQAEIWRPWLDKENDVTDGTYVWRLKGVKVVDLNGDGVFEDIEFTKTGHITILK